MLYTGKALRKIQHMYQRRMEKQVVQLLFQTKQLDCYTTYIMQESLHILLYPSLVYKQAFPSPIL